VYRVWSYFKNRCATFSHATDRKLAGTWSF